VICTIHQPNYLPYLGFFEKASRADTLIIYDNTQFKTGDFQNRNKIRTKDGWIWLTVPVSYKFGDLIQDVRIPNNIKWAKKHWNSISLNYSKAPYFNKYKDILGEIYSKKWEKLVDLNVCLIQTLFDLVGIKAKIVLASDLLDLGSKSTQALIDLCKAVNADQYISGKDGEKYLELDKFKDAGIYVRFQNFKHPVYKQVFQGFEAYMGIIDLLFNHGGKSLDILKSNT